MSLIDDELEEHYPTPAQPGTVIMLTLGQYTDDLRDAYRQGSRRELNPMGVFPYRGSYPDPDDTDPDDTVWGRVLLTRINLLDLVDDALADAGLALIPSDDPSDTENVRLLGDIIWSHATPTDVTDLIETTKETA